MNGKQILAGLAALVVLLTGGCGDSREETVKIAGKPMTEQYVLTEMLRLLIERNTDLTVEVTQGVGGGTAHMHPALVKGDFDLYPEYTGTAWNYVLKKEDIPDGETLYRDLVKEYADRFGIEWVCLYGFNNTYGLAVRKDFADERGIRTYSDLAPHAPELVFGAEYDFFEREDGFRALSERYGFTFNQRVDLDIGLKYQALKNSQVDVINVFTTDGQLASPEVALLEDDRHFYRTYYCGTVARKDTLERHPQLRKALMLMADAITEQDMARMNNAVENEGRSEQDVAREFLISRGLLDK